MLARLYARIRSRAWSPEFWQEQLNAFFSTPDAGGTRDGEEKGRKVPATFGAGGSLLRANLDTGE